MKLLTLTSTVEQTSSAPTNKTSAATLAGAIVTIGVWAAKQWGNLDIPPSIAAAFVVIVMTGIAYGTPPAPRDQIKAKA